jgi:ABC-type proline/glycine betaine transport system permease subunit
VKVGVRRMELLLMWRIWERSILVSMLIVIVIVIVIASESRSETVVGNCVVVSETVFERIPTVLMVSPVLDLFVCTLAAGPKAVIVALWVYEFLLVSRSSQEVVKCFNGYRVINPSR